MSFIPDIPDNAPFSPGQLSWLNGYFAVLFSNAEGQPGLAVEEAAPPKEVSILFGSQTGTAEGVAD